MTISTVRAPKKYLDADRVEVNPAWIEWRDEQVKAAEDELPMQMAAMGIDPAMYFPGDKAIPEDGCWIFVLEEPFTELRDRFRVPLLSMWRCRPHELNEGGFSYGVKSKRVHLAAQQAVIATPGGDLHLWPHEYQIIDNPRGLISQPEATIHSLGGEAVLDEEQMFYLMSRGISHQDAVLLLINTMTAINYIYMTFPEEVTELLRGVGQPLWRHVQLNPRKTRA